MNRAEYILGIVGEEGSEVAHRASKALRFGVDEIQPGQPDTNGERLRFEVYDVISTYILACEDNDGLPPLHLDADIIAQIVATKRSKIERFMAISREQGTLNEQGNATPEPATEALVAALAWFSDQHRLEWSFYSPVYGDDDDQSREWRVHRQGGSINDREWDLIATGETASEALIAAHAAALESAAKGKGAGDAD